MLYYEGTSSCKGIPHDLAFSPLRNPSLARLSVKERGPRCCVAWFLRPRVSKYYGSRSKRPLNVVVVAYELRESQHHRLNSHTLSILTRSQSSHAFNPHDPRTPSILTSSILTRRQSSHALNLRMPSLLACSTSLQRLDPGLRKPSTHRVKYQALITSARWPKDRNGRRCSSFSWGGSRGWYYWAGLVGIVALWEDRKTVIKFAPSNIFQHFIDVERRVYERLNSGVQHDGPLRTPSQ